MLFKVLGLALLAGLFLVLTRKKAPPARIGTSKGPDEILFSMPTLCEAVPPTKPVDESTPAEHMHEDDWRQVEFVAMRDHADVEAMLGEVRASARSNRVGKGFRNIFLRREHPTPLRSRGVAQSALLDAFEKSEADLRPLTIGPIGGSPGIVEGGFAFLVDELGSIYGIAKEGTLETLGLGSLASSISARRLEQLNRFAASFELEVVDWLGERWLSGPDSRG